jgi:hypothetical protein
MPLSNENPNPNTQTIDAYSATLTDIKTKNLADRLVQYEHNPDPREAPNPNAGIRIRRIVPMPSRVLVDEACKNHNSAVASLGVVGEYTR